MKKSEIDIEIMAAIVLEMNDRIKLIMKMFPEKKELEYLLRNLAASAIHLTFFMRDLYHYSEGGSEIKPNGKEEKFLAACGCKNV